MFNKITNLVLITLTLTSMYLLTKELLSFNSKRVDLTNRNLKIIDGENGIKIKDINDYNKLFK